jgi:hypothetical protein
MPVCACVVRSVLRFIQRSTAASIALRILTGAGLTAEAIGIILSNSIWKVGSVLHFSGTFQRHLCSFMCKLKKELVKALGDSGL